MRIALISLVFLVLTGCQTATPNDFEGVEIGAEKGQVLSILGNPVHRYRKNDTDRWVYSFQHGEKKTDMVDKEIWFQNGRVVYMDNGITATVHKKTEPTADDFEPVN